MSSTRSIQETSEQSLGPSLESAQPDLPGYEPSAAKNASSLAEYIEPEVKNLFRTILTTIKEVIDDDHPDTEDFQDNLDHTFMPDIKLQCDSASRPLKEKAGTLADEEALNLRLADQTVDLMKFCLVCRACPAVLQMQILDGEGRLEPQLVLHCRDHQGLIYSPHMSSRWERVRVERAKKQSQHVEKLITQKIQRSIPEIMG